MKTAFKILPAATETGPLHLLAEIGHDGLSLIYYAADSLQVNGWINYQFEKNLPTSLKGHALAKLLEKEAFPQYVSCYIFFNFKETMLVPNTFFREQHAAAMIDCIHGPQPTDAVFSEAVPAFDAMNIYRVDDYIYNTLNTKFLSAVFYHSNTLFLPYLLQQHNELFCTIYHDSIRVILLQKNNLQLVQYFDYNTPSDVAYHLLNTCQQHAVSPAAVQLSLSGFVETDSNLYEELYRYFLNIFLQDLPGGTRISDELKQSPPHFYSHLIALAKCVS